MRQLDAPALGQSWRTRNRTYPPSILCFPAKTQLHCWAASDKCPPVGSRRSRRPGRFFVSVCMLVSLVGTVVYLGASVQCRVMESTAPHHSKEPPPLRLCSALSAHHLMPRAQYVQYNRGTARRSRRKKRLSHTTGQDRTTLAGEGPGAIS